MSDESTPSTTKWRRFPMWTLAVNLGRQAGAEKLLLALWTFADFDAHGPAFVRPSIDRLVRLLGAPRRTIEDRLDQLVVAGLITRATVDGHRGWILEWRPTVDPEVEVETVDRGSRPRPTVDPDHGRPRIDPRPTVDRSDQDPIMGPAKGPAPALDLLATADRGQERPSASHGFGDPRTLAHPRARAGRPHGGPTAPAVYVLPDSIGRMVANHEACWREAMIDGWITALAELVATLQLDVDAVRHVLDQWALEQRHRAEVGTLVEDVRMGRFPELRELWWKRGRAWVMASLDARPRGPELEPLAPSDRDAVLAFQRELLGEVSS